MTNETIALIVAVVALLGALGAWLTKVFQQFGQMIAELKGIRSAVEGVKADVSEVKESVTRAHERIDSLMQHREA